MRLKLITLGISVLGILASIILYFTAGLNYGIDFRGGSMLMVETPEAIDVGALRDSVDSTDVGDTSVTELNDPGAELTGRTP